MNRFFREANGDYLMTSGEMTKTGWQEVRATAIVGLPTSLTWTQAAPGYTWTCTEVRQEDVPTEWLNYLLQEDK